MSRAHATGTFYSLPPVPEGTTVCEAIRYDNTPVHGCRGCETTGGRMACAAHGCTFQIIPSIFVVPSIAFTPRIT